MKKLLMRRLAAGLLVAGSFALVLMPATASAALNPYQGACTGAAGSPACSGGAGTADPIAGPKGVINSITAILSLVLGIMSVIFVIFGGIKYITANGDSSSIASAKNTIIYALIGLVVAALARPIINFVLTKIA